MRWLPGTINKHVVHDCEGDWVGTFRTGEIAAEVIELHNAVDGEYPVPDYVSEYPVLDYAVESDSVDGEYPVPDYVSETGWTNSTKGWGR